MTQKSTVNKMYTKRGSKFLYYSPILQKKKNNKYLLVDGVNGSETVPVAGTYHR
jgi:hypothetical protein